MALPFPREVIPLPRGLGRASPEVLRAKPDPSLGCRETLAVAEVAWVTLHALWGCGPVAFRVLSCAVCSLFHTPRLRLSVASRRAQGDQ